MAQILFLTDRLPWPLDDGNALRVHQLASHLGPTHGCHLACPRRRTQALGELESQGVFRSITLLEPPPNRRSWRRHFRRGDHEFERTAYPRHFAATVARLQDLVDRERIDAVVAVLMRWEEYLRPLRGPAKVVDQYDCATLALERQLATAPPRGRVARWRAERILRRTAAREALLAAHCEMITTIAEPDARRLRELNGPGATIAVVPNGVDSSLLERPRPPLEAAPGICFWGNLAFPVNEQAVRSFYTRVWRPHLEAEGVRWAIVGPNAGPELRALSDRHELIQVPGFVDDLFDYLRDFPLMINPMISGAGLKNKVLEAFAAGIPVVSTSLGVEALPVRDGVHCRVADAPDELAAAVLALLADPAGRRRLADAAEALVRRDYSWSSVAERFARNLVKSGGVQLGKRGGGGS